MNDPTNLSATERLQQAAQPSPQNVILNTGLAFGEGTLADGSKAIVMRLELTLSPEGAMAIARDLMARGQAAQKKPSGLVVAKGVLPKLNGKQP